MSPPNSPELRSRAVEAWLAGKGTQGKIAECCLVGEASVRRPASASLRRTGGLVPEDPDLTGLPLLVDPEGDGVLRQPVA